MTADYLLTARDLPGWKGEFPPIDYKNLLDKSFNELSDSYFSVERLPRELDILKEIAKKHNLVDYYHHLINTKRKNKFSIRNFSGSGFGPRSFFFDSSTIKVNNIYEASIACSVLYNLIVSFSFKNFLFIIFNMINYFIKALVPGNKIGSIINSKK